MIICLGGGCTEAAVMAMYGIVAADTLRLGGMDLDEAIVTYVRRKYGVIIGTDGGTAQGPHSEPRVRRTSRTVWKCRDRTRSQVCRARSH